MAVDRLMADRDFGSDLLRTPLVLQMDLNRKPIGLIYLARITAVQRSVFRQNTRLSGAISPQTRIAGNLPTDCRFMPTEVDCNLGLRQPLF